MKQNRDILSFIDPESAECIFRTLGTGETETRFVGGVVRDAMLGLKSGDIDIATIHHPDVVMEKLQKAGIKAIPTGIKHGTITAVIADKKFEITTLRRDVETDGRHAVVAYTDNWEEDAKRRDFTINAMSCTLEGKIFDYFNGTGDLEKNIVRFVGDPEERIKEDYLRILRFFRFNARFGKSFEKNGLAACKKFKAGLTGLSGERIQSEMLRLLECKTPVASLSKMESSGILAEIIPSSVSITIFEKYIQITNKIALPINAIGRFFSLIHSKELNKNLGNIKERWKLSGLQASQLEMLIMALETINNSSDAYNEQLAKKIIRNYGNETYIHSLITHFSGFEKHNITKLKKLIGLAENWTPPEFPLSGEDLINIGFKSDKLLGDTLKELENDWEHSEYKLSKSALLKSAKSHLSS